jgi:hypothetical protein
MVSFASESEDIVAADVLPRRGKDQEAGFQNLTIRDTRSRGESFDQILSFSSAPAKQSGTSTEVWFDEL